MEPPVPAAVDLSRAQVPAAFLERVPLRFAREHAIAAIGVVEGPGEVLYRLVAGFPDRFWALDRVAYKLDAPVEIEPADPESVRALLDRAFHADAKEVTAIADELSATASPEGEITLTEDVLELDDKAPAVKLVHAMLLQAVKQRASDIHLEPGEGGVRLRFRIDGVLYERARLRPEVRDGLASRIKVMGRMDIAERRLPQDGGVTIRIGQRRVDLRIATLPSQHGERVVMRLLDKQAGLLDLEKLGFAQADAEHARQLLRLAHGIVLVTGPTGSGKTTTLYAMLSAMNSAELNILTLEDPIEYQLPGVSQTQVSEKKGLTFARGLRALVRQDPDVIMVGEIRDLETASVSIQSALTGHLVLSTLHTNDAPTSVARLLDLGVEPYLVASSLEACIAQRLVRKVCPECHRLEPLDPQALTRDGWTPAEVAYLKRSGAAALPVATGCEACFQTGFLGRTAIYEFLLVSGPLRELVHARATAGALRQEALAQGMRTLRQDGLRKVAEGLTTLSEVRAVTQSLREDA
ncbi:MAG: Flp pilus assembly complex ATPase component TadA [Planctomycetes bacterium]|nr:Flp pilus assembly complex ATPase component TadA [Planctomycetota bacterium]